LTVSFSAASASAAVRVVPTADIPLSLIIGAAKQRLFEQVSASLRV
jgi:hypothetical protein